MYEHPIKRAGLSFNRILFSNTKIVQACFPKSAPTRYNLSYNIKTYENGKVVKQEGKSTPSFFQWDFNDYRIHLR